MNITQIAREELWEPAAMGVEEDNAEIGEETGGAGPSRRHDIAVGRTVPGTAERLNESVASVSSLSSLVSLNLRNRRVQRDARNERVQHALRRVRPQNGQAPRGIRARLNQLMRTLLRRGRASANLAAHAELAAEEVEEDIGDNDSVAEGEGTEIASIINLGLELTLSGMHHAPHLHYG